MSEFADKQREILAALKAPAKVSSPGLTQKRIAAAAKALNELYLSELLKNKRTYGSTLKGDESDYEAVPVDKLKELLS